MPTLTVAYNNQSGLNGNQNFSGSLGMDFTVNTPITIYDYGVFDDGQSNMALPITVDIYDVSNGQLVGQALTISGTAGTQVGNSRFETLASPLVLNSGTYSIVASGYGATMENYNQGGGTQNSLLTTNSDGGAISFVGTSRFGSAGAFPTTIDGGAANQYGAGTFEFGTGSTITTSFTVSTEAALNADIASIDNGGTNAAAGAVYTITLTSGFTLSSNMQGVNLMPGSSLTINGGGATINGNGAFRGFFAYSGTLTLNSLTLSNMVAQGGAGGGGGRVGGGGGAGLGGGVFVGANASVTLAGVYFSSDAAKGGAGGTGANGYGHYGLSGGGGLGASGSGVPGISGYNGGNGLFGYSFGGSGEFGGGGGAAGGGSAASPVGGAGGFGGGGGGVYGSSGGTGGTGGFGAGSGGVGVNTGHPGTTQGAGGGGGLGAGGDIFVVQGGSLTVEAGSLAAGTVTGGTAGTVSGGTASQNGTAGSAFGNGLFIEGSQSVVLAPAAGTTLTISGVIADEKGSGGTGANANVGTLVVDGAGVVVLSATNTFTGGTTIEAGGTLDLAASGAASSGAIDLAGTAASALQIQNAALTSNHLANAVTASINNIFDFPGLPYAAGTSKGTVSGGVLSATNGTTTDTFNVTGIANGTTLLALRDASGGTELISNTDTWTVGDETTLNDLLVDINSGGTLAASNTAYVINLAHGFSLNANIQPISLLGGSSLTINGGGYTLNGQNAVRGFFAYAGTIAIDNLTLQNMKAQGGSGGTGGGGGGAGLGGGLFVASGATVTVSGDSFLGNSAVGGNGGGLYSENFGGNTYFFPAPGGGGGMFGSGGGGGNSGTGGGGSGPFGGGGSGSSLSTDNSGNGGNGGFGGGGGGGWEVPGIGGFGGGGGASRNVHGSTGGFGGGGGAGYSGGAAGGFGGGAGSTGDGSAGGGGGLGAGGDIFVQQGGSLIVQSTSLSGGTVTAGSNGGQAFGSGIFLQGNETITLAPASGQVLTISDVLADMSGSEPSAGTGSGGLILNGAGTVVLSGSNHLTGAVSIASGSTLELGASQTLGAIAGLGTIELGSANLTMDALSNGNFGGVISGSGALILQGSGTVTLSNSESFGGGVTVQAGKLVLGAANAAGSGSLHLTGGTLAFTKANAPSETVQSIASGAVIDITNLVANGVPVQGAGDALTIPASSGGITLSVAPVSSPDVYAVNADGNGGTDLYVVQDLFTVGSEAALNAALASISSGGSNAAEFTSYTIDLSQGFALNTAITPIQLLNGATLTLNGGGAILNGESLYRGLFADAGSIAVNNLTLENMLAQGGNGAGGGGGGAGFGGGLFVVSGASVALNGVSFLNNQAIGGNGATGRYGSGGGLAGNGSLGILGVGTGGVGTNSGNSTFPVGNGGFGGGGGGGQDDGGWGGFGGGAGAAFHPGAFGFGGGGAYGGGGGGMAAGADIFVQQGGGLSIGAGGLSGGSLTAGSSPSTGPVEAITAGSGIFLQGSEIITLAPGAGQTLTFSDAIADQSGADPNNVYGARASGGLILDGAGTVALNAANAFTGGISIQAGTLVVGTIAAAGSGSMRFGSGADGRLDIGNAALSSNSFGNAIANFASGDVIDLPGLTFQSGATASVSGGVLSVTSGGITDTLPVSGIASNTVVYAAEDSGTGTEIEAVTALDVSSATQLDTDLAAISSGGSLAATNTLYAIDITQSFTLGGEITPIDLDTGSSLIINGGGYTIDGANAYRGLFAYAGNIAINNLSLNDMLAHGGAGYSTLFSGGGGAGLGGGLFVNTGASVSLAGVQFTGDSADGGNGGNASNAYTAPYGYGSGGGMLGAGTRFAGGYGVNGTGGGTSFPKRPNHNGAGDGLFGGGGGAGGAYGGAGGFGGGGGGTVIGPLRGGSGGFGGGGGNNFGFGGYGGGTGGDGGGGGGLGAGGAIFVRQGGTLVIQSGSISGNSVGYGKGGASTNGETPGSNGAALGSGLFITGDDTVTLAPTAGTTLAIGDTVAGAGGGYSSAGALLIDGLGTVSLSGSNSFAGGITIASGILSLGTIDAAGSGTIAFASGTAGILQVANAALSGNQFGNAIVADNGGTIDLTGLSFAAGATATISNGTLSVESGGVTDTLPVSGVANGSYTPFADNSDPGTEVALCFCAGTQIRTPGGEVAVESLAVGDRVDTWDGGTRPITWIGVGKVRVRRGERNAATPVIVHKGALADNVPNRDLRVTKGHSLLVDDVLIPVEFLVNHRSIRWDDHAQEVSLYHIELDRHDVMVANGAPAESYRDDGNRWLFQNANNGWDLPQEPPCLPVLTGGSIVDAAWRCLLDRAGPRPGMPLTDEPDLHIQVDGQRIDPIRRDDTAHVFSLAAVPRCLRIVSRAASPAELGLSRDPRPLGVALRQLQVWQGKRVVIAEAGDERLTDGFHGYEPEQDVRWTNGDAALPDALLDGFEGQIELVLRVTHTAQYMMD